MDYMEIARMATPADVKVEFRKAVSGRAYLRQRRISVPEPKTPWSLAIYLHELGHVVLGMHRDKLRDEFAAWQFAFGFMRKVGIEITPTAQAKATNCLASYVRASLRRNLTKVPRDIFEFTRAGLGKYGIDVWEDREVDGSRRTWIGLSREGYSHASGSYVSSKLCIAYVEEK